MAAGAVQRLDLKDLDAVLARAKSERWAELGLISSTSIASAEDQAKHLMLKGWPNNRLYIIVHESLLCSPASLYSGVISISESELSLILEIFSLSSFLLRGIEIGDFGAAKLSRLSGLSSLDLAGTKIGDMGVEAIARLTSLNSLDLAGNQIGAAGADAISRLTALTSLDLSGNQIGDAGAKAVAQLTGLTSLNLADNQIGDAGAKALAILTDLTSLNLWDNEIGEAGARAILDAWADGATAKLRRFLDLSDNGHLSELLPLEVLEQTDGRPAAEACA
jgi:hypothetical protein